MHLARSLWLRVETIHAVTYFGEPTIEAGRVAGLTGFWMGYFGFRAAPLGAVGRGAVEATFAANRLVALPDDPVAALWQLCTCLREDRGDGHVAALTASGLDGCEAHVLICLEQGNSPDDLQRARGWTTDDWGDATTRCIQRGLVDRSGALTAEGGALRASVEATTDRLAAVSLDALGPDERAALFAALAPVASARSQPQG